MAFVTKNLRSTVAGRQTGSSMVNRRSAVVAKANNPLGTDTKGKTITGTKDLDSEAAVSQRAADTKEYLNRLPGQGPRSGPFSGVWDPANLTVSAPVEDIRRWRESEITHGRVAMLASVGFIVQEQLEDNNLFLNWDGHIRGQAIHQFDDVQAGFSEALLVSIGLAESYRVSVGWANPSSNHGKGFNHLKDDYELGNLYFDPLGLKPKDETELFDMQSKELNNGRLAMIAIAIFTIQELAQPGVQIFDHWFANAGDSAKEVTNQLPNDLPTPKLPNPQDLPRPRGLNISWALGDGPKGPSIQELTQDLPNLPNAPQLPSLQDLPKPQDLNLPGFGADGPKMPSVEDLPTPRLPGQDVSWALGGGPKPNSNLPGSSDVPNLPNAPKLPSVQDLPKPEDLKIPGFGGNGPKLPSPQDLPRLPGQNVSWALGQGPKPPSIEDLPTPDLPNAPKLPSIQDLPKPQDLKIPGLGGQTPKLPSTDDLPSLPQNLKPVGFDGNDGPNVPLPSQQDFPKLQLPNAPKLPNLDDLNLPKLPNLTPPSEIQGGGGLPNSGAGSAPAPDFIPSTSDRAV